MSVWACRGCVVSVLCFVAGVSETKKGLFTRQVRGRGYSGERAWPSACPSGHVAGLSRRFFVL